MKLGFFIMPVHPLTRNYAETLREDREAFILADGWRFTYPPAADIMGIKPKTFEEHLGTARRKLVMYRQSEE